MCMSVHVYDVCRDAWSPGAGATDCGEPPNVLGAQVMFSAERMLLSAESSLQLRCSEPRGSAIRLGQQDSPASTSLEERLQVGATMPNLYAFWETNWGPSGIREKQFADWAVSQPNLAIFKAANYFLITRVQSRMITSDSNLLFFSLNFKHIFVRACMRAWQLGDSL